MGEGMIQELEMSAEIGTLLEALSKAQGAMDNAKKESNNAHFKTRYADLASVLDAIRVPLAANGLSIVQAPVSSREGIVTVLTLLGHSSGQWMRNRLSLPTQKNDAHGIGSAITYARRYAVMAIAGIAPEDDDGESAVARPPTHQGSWGAPTHRESRADAAPAATSAKNPSDVAKGFADAMRLASMAGDADEVARVWQECSRITFTAPLTKRLGEVHDESLRVCKEAMRQNERALDGAAQ